MADKPINVERCRSLLKTCFQRGVAKGWHGFFWMMKIIVPISFATVLLDFSGWLERLDGILEPMMALIHLPAAAALPLVVGLLTGIYGAIAAMSALPFTVEQMTLIAVFLLIAHNVVQEGMVQHKSGFPFWTATFARLAAAVVTVKLLGLCFGPELSLKTAGGASTAVQSDFWQVFKTWGTETAWLSLKILLIITTLMIVMEFLKQTRFIDKMIRFAGPLIRFLGLEQEMGMLWMTAAIFGITYGGAVIVEETREHWYPPEKLETLHVSIGINHAMIEDPSLFLTLGIHPVWLWVPRFAAALAFARLYRGWQKIRRKRRPVSVKSSSADGR